MPIDDESAAQFRQELLIDAAGEPTVGAERLELLTPLLLPEASDD